MTKTQSSYLSSLHLFPLHERKKLQVVYDFVVKYFSHLSRRSGKNYAEHGMEVALILQEVSLDPHLQVLALLHDAMLHPNAEDILQELSLTADEKKVLTTLFSLRRLHIDSNTKDLDAVIQAFTHDMRVFLIRMAHRFVDVRNLPQFTKVLQKEISRETLHMYTSLAGRLGLHAWRYEMEDICFRCLYPKHAQKLEEQFLASKKTDFACLQMTQDHLKKRLRTAGIPCDFEQRIKALYSTYRKMIFKKRRFDELTDRLALRIIVNTKEDCYRALCVVHEYMRPVPGKLKDYIGAPKENGYQSIHTVVYPLPGVTDFPIEIQIRTKEMNQECEYGIAAHYKYKKAHYDVRISAPLRVNLFRSLELLRSENHSAEEFSHALRSYFDEKKIILFDDKNNMYHLQSPASVLDFLCLVFPERVAFFKSVKINGREKDLVTLLQSGDAIEAHFGDVQTFKKEWGNACRHKKSREIIWAIAKKK